MRINARRFCTTCATSSSRTGSRSRRHSCRSSPSGRSGSSPSGSSPIYAWYVRGHFSAEAEGHEEELSPLRFHRLDYRARRSDPAVPRLRVVNAQVLFALGCIIVGALFFVDAVEQVASALGVDELLLALVVAPIATELPEKFNSIIWVRQGKDTLSMGNITGAMVFQSTIPTVVALVFASSAWHIGGIHGSRLPPRGSRSSHRRRSSSRWRGVAPCGGTTCWSAACSISAISSSCSSPSQAWWADAAASTGARRAGGCAASAGRGTHRRCPAHSVTSGCTGSSRPGSSQQHSLRPARSPPPRSPRPRRRVPARPVRAGRPCSRPNARGHGRPLRRLRSDSDGSPPPRLAPRRPRHRSSCRPPSRSSG